MWLFPRAARIRWVKERPAAFDVMLEHARKNASKDGVMPWRIDGADLLVLDGEVARCEDAKDGVVLVRGDAKSPDGKRSGRRGPG